jgi:hypothetical protein
VSKDSAFAPGCPRGNLFFPVLKILWVGDILIDFVIIGNNW